MLNNPEIIARIVSKNYSIHIHNVRFILNAGFRKAIKLLLKTKTDSEKVRDVPAKVAHEVVMA